MPGFHLAAGPWAAAQMESHGSRSLTVPTMDDPAMAGYQLRHVEGRAGDLLICVHSFFDRFCVSVSLRGDILRSLSTRSLISTQGIRSCRTARAVMIAAGPG